MLRTSKNATKRRWSDLWQEGWARLWRKWSVKASMAKKGVSREFEARALVRCGEGRFGEGKDWWISRRWFWPPRAQVNFARAEKASDEPTVREYHNRLMRLMWRIVRWLGRQDVACFVQRRSEKGTGDQEAAFARGGSGWRRGFAWGTWLFYSARTQAVETGRSSRWCCVSAPLLSCRVTEWNI